MTNSEMTLKLLVGKRDRKVICAEANKDFVDFLFCILTLPIGAITKLLAKDPLSGSLGDLYKSIENLNENYILENKTKDTVLDPKTPSYIPNQDLLLPPKDSPTIKKRFYMCPNRCKYVTKDPTSVCSNCRYTLSNEVSYVVAEAAKVAATAEVGFVKGVVTYMVMDDLVVQPMSTISSITLLNNLSIKEVSVLGENEVHFGMAEVILFLKDYGFHLLFCSS